MKSTVVSFIILRIILTSKELKQKFATQKHLSLSLTLTVYVSWRIECARKFTVPFVPRINFIFIWWKVYREGFAWWNEEKTFYFRISEQNLTESWRWIYISFYNNFIYFLPTLCRDVKMPLKCFQFNSGKQVGCK